jgi:hypothetical protein
MYCQKCGTDYTSKFCPNCGSVNVGQPTQVFINNAAIPTFSPKSKWLAFLLCFFLGYLGVHRFYVGKIGTGIIYLFTAGLLGIGWLVDLITILLSGFRDANGLFLRD